MSNHTERENIMQLLYDKKLLLTKSQVIRITEIIIKDRARIVEPLIRPITCINGQEWKELTKVINETLRRAGVVGEKK